MKSELVCAALLATSASGLAETIIYPTAPSDKNITDSYFGIKVTDEFRPLENDTAKQTIDWVIAENKITQQYLDRIPFKNQLRQRLGEVNNYPKRSLPAKWNDGYYYFYDNDGLQNQSVLFRSKTINGKREMVLDPNSLSSDGTVALTGVAPDKENKYIGYTIARSGSDWTEICVLDGKTFEPLPDHIKWAKFTNITWYGDGFFYSAYAQPEEGKEFSNANEFHTVYYHKLGTPQSDDRIVYRDEQHPLYFHSVYTDHDKQYLFLTASGAGNGNSLMMRPLADENAKWTIIVDNQEQPIDVLDVHNDTLLLLTSIGAPNYRIVKTPIENPQQNNWTDFVAEDRNSVLLNARRSADNYILLYTKDAAHHAYLYNSDGTLNHQIELPSFGLATFWSDRDSNEVLYSFTSFINPATIYSYDVDKRTSTKVISPEIKGYNLEDYITRQVFIQSSDGMNVPMFITHKKGIKPNGKNPTLLYGYGGFNISLYPSFSNNRLLWLENGGIYASVNLRGGGEYGETWHEAGTKMNKINVFNDFIAAAEWLIHEGYTSTKYLAINGGSNGGLLVGAVSNMRPELFSVAIPQVGVMDMLRYHLFTIGWNWARDYGTTAESKEMAQYLRSYSPLHNISDNGTAYPAILITTADHDDRVVPAHSFKYAAALQAANTGSRPKLIRIDSKSGHGSGKPISKVLDEWADIYAFIYHNLGIKPTFK